MTRYLGSIGFLTLLLLLSACTDTAVVKPIATQTKPDTIITHDYGEIDEIDEIREPPIASTYSPSLQLYPTNFRRLSGWKTDDHAAAYQAFRRSCKYWRKQPNHKKMKGRFELGQVGDWKRLCNITVSFGHEKSFFERWFKPYGVNKNGSFKGLFTGYYIPQLRGSYRRSARYNIPIYRKPRSSKLRRLTRSQIYNGGLENKGLEILWVDDLVDAFFMEVQGSGRVLMEDGTLQGVSFSGKNGRGYYAIGKTLVDNEIVAREDISMQFIKQWIRANPDKGLELMKQNRSYVYFRLTRVKAREGAVGAMGQPLTAQRSLAIDRRHLPLGIPIWLDIQHPTKRNENIQNLVMAQDTGGAIKGAIRGDFYWGEGHQAGELAGGMQSSGRFYLLLPRSVHATR